MKWVRRKTVIARNDVRINAQRRLALLLMFDPSLRIRAARWERPPVGTLKDIFKLSIRRTNHGVAEVLDVAGNVGRAGIVKVDYDQSLPIALTIKRDALKQRASCGTAADQHNDRVRRIDLRP